VGQKRVETKESGAEIGLNKKSGVEIGLKLKKWCRNRVETKKVGQKKIGLKQKKMFQKSHWRQKLTRNFFYALSLGLLVGK
jgi:hypothetical protein